LIVIERKVFSQIEKVFSILTFERADAKYFGGNITKLFRRRRRRRRRH
jgi:hypothetical protein